MYREREREGEHGNNNGLTMPLQVAFAISTLPRSTAAQSTDGCGRSRQLSRCAPAGSRSQVPEHLGCLGFT